MPTRGRGEGRGVAAGRLFLILAAGILAFYFFFPRTFLVLENDETHVPLFWISVKGDEVFSLAFKHSYDKAMYMELYRIKGEDFLLTGIRFRSDLNGQGFIFPERDYRLSEGWGTFKGAHKVMTSIPFIMGSPDQANHTLLIQGKRYFLTRYADPGTPVAFRLVKERTFYSLVWRVETWMT